MYIKEIENFNELNNEELQKEINYTIKTFDLYM